MIMPFLRKRWLLLICFSLALPGVYFFWICANYYYASRAAYLLQRIRTLQLDNSSVGELRRLGSERGFRYEEASNCAALPCIHMVLPNNQWMWLLFKSPAMVKIGEHLGLRPWVTAGDIEIENGQVVGKIYAVGFYRDRTNFEIDASASDKRKLDVTICAYYPLKRHPGYAFRNASNIRSFEVLISDPASAANRQNAFQFNLYCLTGWHKCDQFSELMPAAWADYQEDGKWAEIHPNNLVWQLGTPCPY
jgi:hypothetical protein